MAFMPFIGQDPRAPLPVRNVPERAPAVPLQARGGIPMAPGARMVAPQAPVAQPRQDQGGLLSVPYAGARGGILSLGAPEAQEEDSGLLGGLNPLQAIGLALSGAGDLAGGRDNLANSLQTLLAMREMQQKAQGKPSDFLKEINGQLVDLRTGQVVGDFRTPEEPKRDLFTVKQGDQEITYYGDKGDPSTWTRFSEAPRYKPTTNVTINDSRETEFEKAVGKAGGERVAGIFESADKAQGMLANVDRMGQLADQWEQSGNPFGPGVDTMTGTAALAETFGIDPASLGLPENPGVGQALDSLSNELTLGKIGGENGMPANNFSEADRKFVQSTVPRLSDTEQGFRLKLETARRGAQRSLEKEQMWLEYDDAGKSYNDFRRDWAKYVNENPLFSEEEKQAIASDARRASEAPGQSGVISIDEQGNIVP